MKVWQIATGETGRDYSLLFFDHDIMIIGPSDRGDATLNDYTARQPKIHSFAHDPKPKDRVIMRIGKKVIGLGQIPMDDNNQYRFDKTYSCVYGWDLDSFLLLLTRIVFWIIRLTHQRPPQNESINLRSCACRCMHF